MNKRLILRHVFYFSIIAVYCFILYFFKINCPIRWLFHIPCPSCGMTRAMISLFNFDLHAYFYYNPFALPVLFALFLAIHANTERFKSKWAKYYIIIVSILTFIFYIVRLKLDLIP